MAAAVVVLLAAGGSDLATATAAERATSDAGEDVEAEQLLTRARDATAAPHSGRVTVVSFTDEGPRVAQLSVTVADREALLRTPSRIVVAPRSIATNGANLDDLDGQRVPTSPLGMDVHAILEGWDVLVGDRVDLDTGPATPVHLVRASGAAIRETLYVDQRSGIAVRRETRGADGRVLRVVAYTSLDAPTRAGADEGTSGRVMAARTGMSEHAATARAHGYHVPLSLDAGFELLSVDAGDDMAVARYSDGLSIVSVYQQEGSLDADALDGAVVHHVAERDVWTWPGREPVRFVWTGDDRTWTAVSDAPAAVIEDALSALPGDLVGHDAPSRLRRGLDRVWRFVTAPLR